MDVVVLGAGSADGWPNPFCTCASCTTERSAGRAHGQTAVLVDETLLLDCGPETPHAAQRAGVDLTRLRHVLITHAHPDHCAPAFLLFRSWVGDAPLDVVGPAEVVDECRRWVAPDSPVRFVPVSPGDRLSLGGYDVRVLAARHGSPGAAVLFDVGGARGRLLYATDTGPLPDPTVEAVAGARFDAVFLEETFGDHTAHGTDHLDLTTFPEQLRRLHAADALTADTDVVAVHLSHHNPPTPELDRRLVSWGARVVEDGARISARVPVPRPSRTLVIGGARSGKSREAERMLAAEAEVTYVATSYPAGGDAEWAARVKAHRERRPPHWRTVETLDLVPLLEQSGEPLLVDCLTLWLTRMIDQHGGWQQPDDAEVDDEIARLVTAWRATRRRVVAVTNEVGQGVVPDTASGRLFRDTLGRLNAALAAETEDVRWCAAGRVVRL